MMFREAVEKRMREMGMTQADVCRASGVHTTTLNRWLLGKSQLSERNLEDVVKALGEARLVWQK
jgi:transcriptional regulator with XRE-family HTH domain